MLKLKNITKDYVSSSETVKALKGVNVCFRQKEFVSVLGPSGCGKTTLLNIIGGLDHYTDGDLVIGGKSTKLYSDRDWDVYRNHRVGFIFQSYNLIPHQTVLGNVELALTIAGISKEERVKRAKRALDRVGLADKYYKRPNQLSGGQCQRVAIARALVNDPEILLADEPTGALDTATSKQIMDLIREISGERLVIMVTHNPEIAVEYSSRIIRLVDGLVIEDSNPFSEEDEEEEVRSAAESAVAADSGEPTEPELNKKPKKKAQKEKAKMSFFTAFMLSAKNLLSKKGRTTMVGFAGSIGIIGIALVLAFSAGIKGYIASMQDDMLSGNPITISETGFNAAALSEIMESANLKKFEREYNKVFIESLVENLAEMSENLEKLFSENTLTPEYIQYVSDMPAEYYQAMLKGYGIDISLNLFTDFKLSSDSEAQHISIKRLIDNYSSVLRETEYAKYSSFIPYLAPSMTQAPSNPDYILSQYELLGDSKVATEKDEIMLVLNSRDELSDLLLAAFGYYTQDQFLAIVDKATAEDPENFDTQALYKEYFEYNELLGKEFVWYPTDTVFTSSEGSMIDKLLNGSYKYNSKLNIEDMDANGGVKLKVVGILAPKENVSYGSLKSGIYYTEALTEHILQTNESSEYIEYLKSDLAKTEIGPRTPQSLGSASITTNYTTIYLYDYIYNPKNSTEAPTPKMGIGWIAPASTASITSISQSGYTDPESQLEKDREAIVRNHGGNAVANSILIYPLSFDDKDFVTEYLDLWDDENTVITVNGIQLSHDDRTHVTYTDPLELIINMINTMIDVISYALIAFTSVSLVVSTVMIGIITYISVVERIKEIGVIRSLGGRKKDVRHLFNAETFIIGLLAGMIGVGATYLISAIVNLILNPLINYARIAALPISNAVILVLLSVILTCISGLIPASSAAKKDPVIALRTE